MVKTSYPAKATLSLNLDEVHYTATIAMWNVRLDTIMPDEPGKLIPAH